MNSTLPDDWNPFLIAFIGTPDVLNLITLMSGLIGMFNGIEIDHPIYAVLFSNMSVCLFSASVNVVTLFCVNASMFVVVANASNTWYMIYHCVTWSVTSLLRYAYIFHGPWIDSRFPDASKLRNLSVVSTFVVFVVLLTPLVAFIVHLGECCNN